MKYYYVVYADWCVDYQAGHQIVGVYTSKDKAIKALKKRVDMDDRILAKEYGYEIYEDEDDRFDSGIDGYYVKDHICVCIEEVSKTNEAGYKEDPIFLMSDKEYLEYKDRIPTINSWWWTRTPSSDDICNVLCAYSFGKLDDRGKNVENEFVGVRPALKSEIFQDIGKKYSVNTFSFICIDNGLGIATVPICFGKFDIGLTNNYENSHIRKYLLDWLDNRDGDNY